MKKQNQDLIRMRVIIFVCLLVIVTGAFFSYYAFRKGELAGGILGGLISLTILTFGLIVFIRGNNDLKNGFPLKDERSIKVMEKASSKAFYVSLYLLLAIGFLSDDLLKFRDASQATGIAVGCMALIFTGFWLYYNGKGDFE